MLSVLKLRYACCSVQPSGNTARSSRRRYSSTSIQFISLIRMQRRLTYVSQESTRIGRAFEQLFNFQSHNWSFAKQSIRCACGGYHLKVTPRTDPGNSGAAGQQPLIEPKRARSESASTLN